MNFLNFLTSGANLFNFGLQNSNSTSIRQTEPKGFNNSQIGLAQLKAPGDGKPSTKSEVQKQIKILSQQQMLVNQYMHMNIQLLSQKLECLQKQPKNTQKDSHRVKVEAESQEKSAKEPRKKTKKIIKCGHQDKQHYAKGMCNNCYHKFGRTKKPWNCRHDKLYAAGMCQNCYINNYNKKRRLSSKVKNEQERSQYDQLREMTPEQNEQPSENNNA